MNYTNRTKVARMTATLNDIGANGKIKFFTAADVLLCVFTLAATPGTVAGAGVATFSDANGGDPGILTGVGVAAGNAAKATITTSGDAECVVNLTVGTAGTDFIINNVNIAIGQSVTVNSATLTHAA